MGSREKLIDILVNLDTYGCEECQKCASFKYDLPCNDKCFCEKTADHLIANGVTIQRWIPVTEQLPENDRQRVLAVCIGDCPIGYPKIDTDRYVRGHWVRYGNDVTHWMPLPEPPIEEQNRAREENDG